MGVSHGSMLGTLVFRVSFLNSVSRSSEWETFDGFAILAVHNNNENKTRERCRTHVVTVYVKTLRSQKIASSMDFFQWLSNQSVASFRPDSVDEKPRMAVHGSQRHTSPSPDNLRSCFLVHIISSNTNDRR